MKGNKKQTKNQNKKTEKNDEMNKSTPIPQQYTFPFLNYFTKLKKNKGYKSPFAVYTSIYKTLKSLYSIKLIDYTMFQLENLLESKGTHKVAVFKDHMIMDYHDEFLKREYSRKESVDRIPKFVNYYKNYLLFFCKPTFCDFDINFIIQSYGEKCAEMYYNRNYVKQDKKKKKKLPNEELRVIFSSTIKDNINDNSMTNQSIAQEYQPKHKKNIINVKDTTLQLSGSDFYNHQKTALNINNIEDDSILSIVNKINMKLKEKKDTITIPSYRRSIKENKNMTDRVSSGDRGSLAKLIDTKCLLPTHVNTLYKLKSNPLHVKNVYSTQIQPSNESNKLNINITPINQRNKQETNFNKVRVDSRTKNETSRNIVSSIPFANSNDNVRSPIKMYSTHNDHIYNHNSNIIQHSNSNSNQQNQVMISSMTYHNNYLSNEVSGRKTMSNIQIKNIKSTSKNPPQSRNRQLSDGLQMPTVNRPVYSSFNYFDKQQQLLNINKKSFGECFTSSASKGASSIMKKKNSRFNSDPFKTSDRIVTSKGKIKLGIASNANLPLTKRNNLPIESLIKLCRDKPVVRLGKNNKI